MGEAASVCPSFKAIMDSMNQQCGVKNYDNGVEFWFELEAKA